MTKIHSVLVGKAVRHVARLRGGSGSALPGLVVEKLDKSFVTKALAKLPHGTVIISGTNGKTTTTKMVVELLESQGLRVFTNKTGSNFSRGVAAALLSEMNARGKLKADIAVLEMDEAHAVHLAEKVKPRYTLLLNVMRDQLDRFGEIDHTAKLLHRVAAATTDGVIVNRDDSRLLSEKFIGDLTANVSSFGVSQKLLQQFPSDDDMRSLSIKKRESLLNNNDTCLESIDGNSIKLTYNGKTKEINLKVNGLYNMLNAVGAFALCREIMGEKINEVKMLDALSKVTPAFGRGEDIVVDGLPCQLILVKNPGGFRLGLQSFDPKGYAVMIAINDNYADGRDMSWLWDVEFDTLRPSGVSEISGSRGYDMALRLQYDDVSFLHVDTDLKRGLKNFLQSAEGKPKRIYCTYTAMMALRRELGKIADVKEVK